MCPELIYDDGGKTETKQRKNALCKHVHAILRYFTAVKMKIFRHKNLSIFLFLLKT